jgi:hypothetical protein
MPKLDPWCRLACVAMLLIAAPAWAQQKSANAPPANNAPMFKEPLGAQTLFPGKRKPGEVTPQMQPQAPLQAQRQPRAAAPFKKRFFDKLDTNFDGIVSRAEFLAQANRQFDMLDLNHDGRLTADEINAVVVKAQPNPAQ